MEQIDTQKQKALDALFTSSILSVFIVLIHIIKWFKGARWSHLGVFPRELDGMLGIFTSPLIHGDWEHLFSNILPFFMLTFTIGFFYRRIAVASFVIIYVATGFMVWFLARPVYHIGASGVVYGLVSFVFWLGIFRRNIKSIVLALSVLVLYSGYFMGIVPFKEGVSWESHLFGAIVGIVTAFLLKKAVEKDEEEKRNPWAYEQYEQERYFLRRDTFEKTKMERYLEERKKIEEEGQPFRRL